MFPWSSPTDPLRCDDFIAAALHHPEHGYYGRRIRNVGRGGDFTTTAVISPALPAAIASWALRSLRETGCRDLIELGPGDGTLAAGVLARLPWWRRIRLHLVESSAPLRRIQQDRLGNRVRWHPDAASALAACKGRACLYSNEFFDAFPVRRFRFDGSAWSESHILPGLETWREAGPLPDSTHFHHPWPAGQIIEVHEACKTWLESLASHWRAGAMLTLDYGALVHDLHPRRPGGSLRAYFHHQCLSGHEVFLRPGHQDITADVNFSDLIRWLPSASHSLRSQHDFLQPFADPADPADLHAIDPDGAGSAFLVLDSRLR